MKTGDKTGITSKEPKKQGRPRHTDGLQEYNLDKDGNQIIPPPDMNLEIGREEDGGIIDLAKARIKKKTLEELLLELTEGTLENRKLLLKYHKQLLSIISEMFGILAGALKKMGDDIHE